ncbi:hypothetical protein MBLNU459_g3882t2 [Dothideomycetes sp. NU459]
MATVDSTTLPTATATSASVSPFPAATKTAACSVANVPTTVQTISFADKLLVTISQSGRLNHWVHVPLSGATPTDSSFLNPTPSHADSDVDATLLPFPHLTATTVFGGTKREFEVLGQTLATTLASAVLMRNPGEGRMVVLGLGLERADGGRAVFEELVGLCLECI